MKTFLKFMIIYFSIYSKFSIVNTWNIPVPDSSKKPIDLINEVTVKLLTKCYADHMEIVIHSDTNKFSIKSILDTGSFAIIMPTQLSTPEHSTRLRLHMNSFVATPRSISQLKEILATFKNTPHWNIKSPFFILDDSNNKCENAEAMLHATWEMNIIKSFFICVDDSSKPTIYTYHPYSNRAPKPWKRVTKLPTGWTMYRRPSQIKNMCAGLNFARTEHLDGAVIRLAVELYDDTNLDPNKTHDESIMPRMFKDMSYLATKIKDHFNATLHFKFGSVQQLYRYVHSGVCDVALIVSIDEDTSHTVRYNYYHIVSNHRISYTALKEIQQYYGVFAFLSISLVVLISFLGFIFTENRRRWISTGLKILHSLINKSLYTQIDRAVLKIFLCSVFLYFIAMQAIFFGNLSSVLTQQQLQPNPETMEDLRDPQYDPIHISRGIKKFINDPILQKKIKLGPPDCIPELLENESAVCIYSTLKEIESVLRSKFHVSQRPVYEIRGRNPPRDDWPLLDRFNKLLKSLESHGHSLSLLHNGRTHGGAIDTDGEISTSRRIHFSPISLTMSTWFLILLPIGLVIAIIFCISERYCKNITRIKMEPPKQEPKIRMKRRIAKEKNELNQNNVAE